MKFFGQGGGHGLRHVFIKGGGGYCKMTQIDTRGEGGGSKIVQKFNTYFINGPLCG